MGKGPVNTGGGGSGGTLTVTAPGGVTVTAIKDGKIKTKTANAEGIAVFKGLASGTWQLTISDGSTSSTPIEVVIVADYSTRLAFFAATINVTYPSGSICTATDGETSFTAPDTSGTWALTVPNTGEWTISCTDGDKTTSNTVTITEDGQVESVMLAYILYLFTANDTHDEVTGGYVTNTTLGYTSAPGLTIGDTMLIKQPPDDTGRDLYGQILTNNAIDLSAFDTLHMTYTFSSWAASGYNAGRAAIELFTDRLSSASKVATVSLAGNTSVTLDLSEVNEPVYIGFFIFSGQLGNAFLKISELFAD